MKPNVIYPWGPLVDLVDVGSRGRRVVYAIEFSQGHVKVGCSQDPRTRMNQVVNDGRKLGLTPIRFFFGFECGNATRIEKDVLEHLRAQGEPSLMPADVPAASEWIGSVSLEQALDQIQLWESYPDRFGRPVGVRSSDLADKARAEEFSARAAS